MTMLDELIQRSDETVDRIRGLRGYL